MEAELGEGLARLWLESGLVRPPDWPAAAASAAADWLRRPRGRRALRWTAARPQLTAGLEPAATTAAAEQGAERPAEETKRSEGWREEIKNSVTERQRGLKASQLSSERDSL